MLSGVAPRRAGSIDAALASLGSESVDAVVINAHIPDSFNLLTFLRATSEYAHVPVLLFTDVALTQSEAELAERNGAEIFPTPHQHLLVGRLADLIEMAPAGRLR
jgi:hypothetical protein